MSQCSRFFLTEGKQVPLPQCTNDPIISIRSLDWCYTPLPFTLSVSLSLKYSLFPKSHLDWVYVPPQARYSMYKARRGWHWWWRGRIPLEHNKQREVWMKTIRPFLTQGQCFIFISTVGSEVPGESQQREILLHQKSRWSVGDGRGHFHKRGRIPFMMSL